MLRNPSPLVEPVENLDENFKACEKPEGPVNRNTYQECLVCCTKFFGGETARKSHISGVKINGCTVASCKFARKYWRDKVTAEIETAKKIDIEKKGKMLYPVLVVQTLICPSSI